MRGVAGGGCGSGRCQRVPRGNLSVAVRRELVEQGAGFVRWARSLGSALGSSPCYLQASGFFLFVCVLVLFFSLLGVWRVAGGLWNNLNFVSGRSEEPSGHWGCSTGSAG